MLKYDRIDVSERIDVNKTNTSNTVIFVIIDIFLGKGFKYEPYFCNGCHNLMQKAMNFDDFAIVFDKGSHYRINFWYMSKDDAIFIVKNSDLNEKSGLL